MPARYLLLLLALTGACGDDPTDPTPTFPEVASLHVVAAPSSALIMRPLGIAPTVELRDPAGRPVALGGVTVTVSVTAGTLSGTTSTKTDAQGRAVFDDLVLDGDEGVVELSFQCCGLEPAAAPLTLSLADPTLRRASAASVTSMGGYPLASPVRVEVLDGRGDPLGGEAVRFTLIDPTRPIDETVVSDENGIAELSYVVHDLPWDYTLVATLVSTGAMVEYAITVSAPGQAVPDGTEPFAVVVDPHSTVTLPSLSLRLYSDPADGAHVLYRIVHGTGVLSRDTVFTTGGTHEPVTVTVGARGLTIVEIVAPGYMYQPLLVPINAVTGPITFSLPDPCGAGCQPASFDWPSGQTAGLAVQVRDGVGPLEWYPVQVDYPLTAGEVWISGGLMGETIPPGGWVTTGEDGIAVFYWDIPAESGSYSIQLSGPRVVEPWTFTANRP